MSAGRFARYAKPWLVWEATPIVALVFGACSWASYCTWRSAMGPTIQWSSANPEPWNSIKPNEGAKMFEVNHKFPQSWHRDKL